MDLKLSNFAVFKTLWAKKDQFSEGNINGPSFSEISYSAKTKESSLLYYLPNLGGRTDRFVPFTTAGRPGFNSWLSHAKDSKNDT